jgi:hypothetical protein
MKTLSKLLCIGALALTGCGANQSQYNYDGYLDEDRVEFKQNKYDLFMSPDNILTITKKDGKIIRYQDMVGNNLKIETVVITKDDQRRMYEKRNADGKQVVIEGQKQFDAYLKKILETKIKEGLDNLK